MIFCFLCGFSSLDSPELSYYNDSLLVESEKFPLLFLLFLLSSLCLLTLYHENSMFT